MADKGFYSSLKDHEYGKPLINPPTIGKRQVSVDEYRDFIYRGKLSLR